jgi:hypothetical protein
MMVANLIRLGLGIGQMFCAALSFVLLIDLGISEVSLGAVVATCVLTTISVLLFGKRSHRTTREEEARKW